MKASPPSSPSQQFVAASDMMPEFLVRKSILAPKVSLSHHQPSFYSFFFISLLVCCPVSEEEGFDS